MKSRHYLILGTVKREKTQNFSFGQLNFPYGNIIHSEMDQGWKNSGLIQPTKLSNRSTTT
jgi:hypothetical protein